MGFHALPSMGTFERFSNMVWGLGFRVLASRVFWIRF